MVVLTGLDWHVELAAIEVLKEGGRRHRDDLTRTQLIQVIDDARLVVMTRPADGYSHCGSGSF